MMPTIDEMLTSLIGIQDSVTHMNANGPGFEEGTKVLIEERDAQENEILSYVKRLEHEKKAAVDALYGALNILKEYDESR